MVLLVAVYGQRTSLNDAVEMVRQARYPKKVLHNKPGFQGQLIEAARGNSRSGEISVPSGFFDPSARRTQRS